MLIEKEPKHSKKFCPTCEGAFESTPMVVCPRDGTLLLPEHSEDAALPEKYKIVKRLAFGTVSTIFECVDESTNMSVAVKIPRIGIKDPQSTLKKERFLRQVSAHKFLSHRNIVPILHDGVTDRGTPFLVFELVEGGLSLADLQGQLRDLPLSYFKEIFIQTCEALEFAHSKDILHQDLSPGDILIGKTENDGIKIKVTDFAKGAALLHGENRSQQSTARKDLFGNASFMSPEVGMSQPLTAASNVYSLGCIMYSVLSTREPFEGMHWAAIMLKKINDNQLPLELNSRDAVSQSIEAIVAKCLKVDPHDRYQSVKELKTNLEKFPLDKSKTRYSVLSSVLKTRLNR